MFIRLLSMTSSCHTDTWPDVAAAKVWRNLPNMNLIFNMWMERINKWINFYSRPVLAFRYCHCLHLCVWVHVRVRQPPLQWLHNERDGPWLFTQPFIQAQMKENIKALCHWPFVWGIHRSPVNSPQEGSVTRKKFPFDDVMMPSLSVP